MAEHSSGAAIPDSWDGSAQITPAQAHEVAANWKDTTQLSNALDAAAFLIDDLQEAAAEMVAAADATWGLDVWRKWEMENGPSGRWVKALLALEELVRS